MAMKRVIRVVLDEDTAEFLAASRADQRPEAVSAFINSLLRQENFRHGDPLRATGSISSHPARGPAESALLRRSGLLPLQPRRRRH